MLRFVLFLLSKKVSLMCVMLCRSRSSPRKVSKSKECKKSKQGKKKVVIIHYCLAVQ